MSTAHSFGEAAVLDTLSVNLQSIHLTEEQFYRLCEDNPELRLELTARGELIVMSPTGSKTGLRNSRLNTQLGEWAQKHGGGVTFDSSTGFALPNGAKRSPDASFLASEGTLGRAECRGAGRLCAALSGFCRGVAISTGLRRCTEEENVRIHREWGLARLAC